jgi:hypothetical protein
MFLLVLHVYLLHLIIPIVDGEIYKLCAIRDVGLCGKRLSAEIHLNHNIEKFSFTSQRTNSVFIIKIKHLILCERRDPFFVIRIPRSTWRHYKGKIRKFLMLQPVLLIFTTDLWTVKRRTFFILPVYVLNMHISELFYITKSKRGEKGLIQLACGFFNSRWPIYVPICLNVNNCALWFLCIAE